MQHIKNSILSHLRYGTAARKWLVMEGSVAHYKVSRHMCASTSNSSGELIDRVVGLVKKYDKTDGAMVTETSDFQKDLSLDSLDRVELVMAFEQEFSVEIPDEVADKFNCCADVAKYISSVSEGKKIAENS
ncbi:hypothetical protein Sjap_003818 [Stephania japonica]|uniref:Acyl carrier protein n=1 Tax=Stephania japonica TaxID=461633 RepID=A0AAP0PTY6_9MAGN